jgi:NADP-dependent 3-hydroxy acid dehydrogenase YdfG
MTLMLHDVNAIIYGAGGSLGGEVARALAKAGATVFVTGRRLTDVKTLASEIVAAGGKAEAAEVDALEPKAVNDVTCGTTTALNYRVSPIAFLEA